MFTGIVESIAKIVALNPRPPGVELVIQTNGFCQPDGHVGVRIGDSIAINGCCLTVVAMKDNRFTFEAGSETLSRTNLGELVAGESAVNVERAVAVGDRMGGHYVTGHVDTVGRLLARTDDPPWSHLRFSISRDYAVQVVGKGSITIDGVSLTVVDAGAEDFMVALIPHTLQHTTLGARRVGDRVNLETDLLAKYVQRLVAHDATGFSQSST